MKIALMSGAYKNAGDFLIENRSKCILNYSFPNAQIDLYKRDLNYDDIVEQLNSYDAIVFGGGPGFQKNIYPDKMPFVSNLHSIETPCTILGWGWKGHTNCNSEIYKSYSFSKDMNKFLEFMSLKKNHMSCRDWYTKRMLSHKGYNNVVMTGCPAWYDVNRVKNLTYKGCSITDTDNMLILVSDAALPHNIKFMPKVIETLRKVFPKAQIKVLFHRGITEKNVFLTKMDWTEKLRYEYEDISGSADGFSQYDNCDLHVGFRVHAHIYNLSHGNTSVLINEDARGFGVNDAMGLPNIPLDKFVCEGLENAINTIIQSDGVCFRNSSNAIKNQFEQMEKFVKGII